MTKETIIKNIKELLPYILILIAVIVVRTFFVTPVLVNGNSMEKTLHENEVMLLNKRGKIERFSIIVIHVNEEINGQKYNEDLIKRVIALPGETVTCENGKIYVNGKIQEDDYAFGITSNFEPIELGEDEYFAMGDNREVSLDSRYFGAFNIKQIKGTADFILFPFKRWGHVE